MATSPLPHLERVRALAVSGRLLALGGVRARTSSLLTFVDYVAKKPAGSLELPGHVLALAASQAAFVAGSDDGRLRVIPRDAPSVTHTLEAHRGSVRALAIAGDLLASVGDDGVLATFSLARGELLRRVSLSALPLRAVAIDAEGTQIAAAGDDGVVRVVSLADESRREMPGHEGAVRALAFTPLGGRLVSGGEDGTLRIWYLVGDVESELRGADESGHAGGVTAIAFVADREGAVPTAFGGRLVSVGADGKLRLWQLEQRKKPRTYGLSGVLYACVLAPMPRRKGARVLFTAGDARTLFELGFDVEGSPANNTTQLGHGFVQLTNDLRSGGTDKRKAALQTLASLEEPEARELIMSALKGDARPDVRALAAELLGQGLRRAASGDASRVTSRKALRAALDDAHESVRAEALSALLSQDLESPRATLAAALASRFADVRIRGLRGLVPLAVQSPLAVVAIAGRLADATREVREEAHAALAAAIGDDVFSIVRIALERGAPDVRAAALVRGAAGGLSSEPRFSALVAQALDDDEAEVRAVAFTLRALERPRLATWLTDHDDHFARSLAQLAARVAKLASPESASPSSDGGVLPAPGAARHALLVQLGVAPALPDAAGSLTEQEREPLLAALACRAQDTALRSARSLAALSDPRALGTLMIVSREDDPELRRAAAEVLATIDDARARDRLAWMMSDASPLVRDMALTGYARGAASKLDLARTALASAAEDVRLRALTTIAELGSEGEPLLGAALDDEAKRVRDEAFRALWARHPDGPLVPLERALGARFADLRKRAIGELGTLVGDASSAHRARASELLLSGLADRDADVADAAYHAARELLGKDHVDTLRRALEAKHPALRTRAAQDAREARLDALVRPLTKLLEDENGGVRRAAIDALDVISSQPGPLYTGLAGSHLDVRVRAAELLAVRRDERLIEPMRALLADETLVVRFGAAVTQALRRGAATALASLGSARLLDYFAKTLIEDEDPLVREQAARGVAGAATKGGDAALLAQLEHADLSVRSWAAEGLARLGDVRGLPVLVGTLRHEHPPLRVGAVLSCAALGEAGRGGLLIGLEDPSREVQAATLAVILARDLRAARAGEPPDLLVSALSSARPEVRFAAARALELRAEPVQYAAHLVALMLPERPEKAEQMARWPSESVRTQWMTSLAEALAGDRPEQRYAAAQVLSLRGQPLAFFREAERVVRLRSAGSTWVAETSPVPTTHEEIEAPRKGRLAALRRLFARGESDDAPLARTTEGDARRAAAHPVAGEPARLRLLAFGAYVGLLRQASDDEEAHRVRRDTIDRIVALSLAGHVARESATPALARALDDPHHLVRRAAFAALKKVYGDAPDEALSLALAARSVDVVRAALDELAGRGDEASLRRIAMSLEAHAPEARRHAFELLDRLSPKGSLEPLLLALSSSHADLGMGVLERLARTGDDRVAPALARALASEHEALRLRAAELLVERSVRDASVAERAVEVFASALRAESDAVATRARKALTSLASEAAVSTLSARLLESESEPERLALVDALGAMRPSQHALDALLDRLDDENVAVAERALSAALALLGERPAPRTVVRRSASKPRDPALLARFCERASQSARPAARLAAARELDLPEAASFDACARALFGDRDTAVRAAAIASYAKRVEQRGADVEPLVQVVALGARDTLLPAALGLAARGVSQAFVPLLLVARAGEPHERSEALLGLGTLGDVRALAELEQIADGGTPEAPVDAPMRAAALEALGRMLVKIDDLEARARVRERIDLAVGDSERGLSVAAVRALRFVPDERARGVLEAVLVTGLPELADAAPSAHFDVIGPAERTEAAWALGERGDVHAESALAAVLRAESDEALAWLGYRMLERLFPDDRTRYELEALRSPVHELRAGAVAYLAEQGDVLALIDELPALEGVLAQRLRLGLSRRTALPIAALRDQLSSRPPERASEAAWLLGLHAEQVADGQHGAIVEALADVATRAWQTEELPPPLRTAQGRAENVRALAVSLWAARRHDARPARAIARTVCASDEAAQALRSEAARVLAAGTSEDVEVLTRALTDAHSSAPRASAAAALAASGAESPALVPDDPTLRSVLERNTTPDAAAFAQRELRVAVGPRLLREGETSTVIALVRSGDVEARRAALSLLGLTANEAAIAELARLARPEGEPDESLRRSAYKALRRAQRLAAARQEGA